MGCCCRSGSYRYHLNINLPSIRFCARNPGVWQCISHDDLD
ncbi:unnamed protein product [Amoebophrya sp. A120]|nr:unnamed protein product [Amoebophrya sp. A120]|eukprot:GSA120T00005696001.1